MSEEYLYNYGSEETYSEDVFIGEVYKPVMKEKSKNIQVMLGHTIILPCIVDCLPGKVMKII
jgi:hypothetical protein